MRLLLLSTFHERCGIATYSESLVAEFRALGIEPIIFAPHRARGDLGRGEQPERLWNRNRAFGFEAFRVHRAIIDAKVDIVHAQVNLALFSSRFLFTLARLLDRSGIPLVATLHGRKGGSLGRNFKVARLLYGLRRADLIVHNEAHRRELSSTRVHQIPHGIDPILASSQSEAREALGIDPSRKVIAHFGFLVPDKGVLETLESVARLRARRLPDLDYWICGAMNGSAESRAYFDEIRGRVDELGLREHVHLTGEFVPEERALLELSASDWVVLNYRTGSAQGASGAARRALASGRPVAVSKAPIFDDIRNATHTMVGPIDGAISRLFEEQTLAAETAHRARQFSEENSWSAVAGRHLELYESISRSRKR